jgi:thiol-disulfide isomerase/thioredoxin
LLNIFREDDGMGKTSLFFYLVIFIVMVILTGCLNTHNLAINNKDNGNSQQDLENDVITIPPFNLEDIYQNIVSNDIFSDYKLTLVNIWAVGDQNCAEELPYLQEIYTELKDQSINVIGIIAGGEKDDAIQVLNKRNITYTNIIPDERLFDFILEIAPAVPTSLLVDNTGHSLTKPIVGARTKKEFSRLINDTIKLIEQ